MDTEFFRPAGPEERRALRARRDLPLDRFVIFLSSRISHEKDPETVLRATAIARSRGVDAVLLNLGGGYLDFLRLARELGLPDVEGWVLGRPAAHPMTEVADYFRAADVMALASLAEGAGFSTLEALACGTPVVATAVGGMAVILAGLRAPHPAARRRGDGGAAGVDRRRIRTRRAPRRSGDASTWCGSGAAPRRSPTCARSWSPSPGGPRSPPPIHGTRHRAGDGTRLRARSAP